MKAIHILIALMLLLGAGSCRNSKSSGDSQSKSAASGEESWYIDPAGFRSTIDGRQTDLYRLSNEAGMEVYVTNFGAVIVAILAPDRDGKMGDITLGYDSVGKYAAAGDPYFGAVVGRYGNRIDGGKFKLNGKEYGLVVNETANNNQLHGGPEGFSEQVWETGAVTGNSIVLKLHSPDGQMGYPGNLDLSVHYTLTDDNELKVMYMAQTDAPTPLNVTQHTYFNLNGEGSGDILNHELMINADYYTPVNQRLIPIGEIASVDGTPMDFRSAMKVGSRIGEDFEQLKFGMGYDHNWVLNGEGMKLAAELYAEKSGRFMEVHTTEPGVQFYCGNFLDGTLRGKSGALYKHRYGLCLETQHFPDSPNQPGFPSTILNPGEQFHSETIFRFSVK